MAMQAEAQAKAQAPYDLLVDVATLAAHVQAADWCVIDCRHQLSDPHAGERAYLAGHLPGAVFLHLDRDLSGPLTGRNGRHPLPDPQALAARLGAAGIGPGIQVVVYDDAGGMVAGRLWWLLRWLGHRSVALLDGGYAAWVSAGLPLATEIPTPLPRQFPQILPAPVLSAAQVAQQFHAPSAMSATGCLIDGRATDRFRGENETLDPVGGHIPGARNRFFRDNLDAAGFFKPAAELRNEFLALLAGADPAQTVLYCGSGVSACLNLLAMERAGLTGAQLYPGSWSEWCADPARPVAR